MAGAGADALGGECPRRRPAADAGGHLPRRPAGRAGPVRSRRGVRPVNRQEGPSPDLGEEPRKRARLEPRPVFTRAGDMPRPRDAALPVELRTRLDDVRIVADVPPLAVDLDVVQRELEVGAPV